jgi:putative permease
MQLIRSWIQRILPNAQAVSLSILLVVGFIIIVSLGNMLAPVFAAAVIAYLLDSLVSWGERRKMPRLGAVVIVFILFLCFVLFVLVALLPLLYQQTAQFILQLPSMVNRWQELVMKLPEQYPNFITETQISEIMTVIRRELIAFGQSMLTYSYSSLVGFFTLIVYLILVPMLVFFFLKDKHAIIGWITQYLPRERHLPMQVWREVDVQIGNYIRGKFIEILILFAASFITFSLLGINYALLLSVLIGFSVLIPYVGATLVTIPVMFVAYFQWGLNDNFYYLLLAYLIVQTLDGVLLVPLLFSEAVNLHPVAIIVAVLFFGGLWGFWGVFFAIPLATLVKAVLTAWPRMGEHKTEDGLAA